MDIGDDGIGQALKVLGVAQKHGVGVSRGCPQFGVMKEFFIHQGTDGTACAIGGIPPIVNPVKDFTQSGSARWTGSPKTDATFVRSTRLFPPSNKR